MICTNSHTFPKVWSSDEAGSVSLIKAATSSYVFMRVHWLKGYGLYSFPGINWRGSLLSDCLSGAKTSRDTNSRGKVRDGGITGVGRIAIYDLWLILAEVAGMRGKWGRPLCPPSAPSDCSLPPLLNTPLIPGVAWSALRGEHAVEQPDNFQADCFYFRPIQGLMKTNWQNKEQQINDPCSPLLQSQSPTIDSWHGKSLPFLPLFHPTLDLFQPMHALTHTC